MDGAVKKQLATGDTIFWSYQVISGRNENQYRLGVAVIVKKEKSNALLEWKATKERLIHARCNSRFIKISVIICYEPSEDADIDAKTLSRTVRNQLRKTSRSPMALGIGDLNGEVTLLQGVTCTVEYLGGFLTSEVTVR